MKTQIEWTVKLLQASILSGMVFCTSKVIAAPVSDLVSGQTSIKTEVTKTDRPLIDVFHYFAGTWSGAGEFASGKKIEADVSFSLDLDNTFMLYRHTDRLPNKFKSVAMWGIERKAKKLSMVMTDNFGSIRLFSANGWQDDEIVFADSLPISAVSSSTERQERFIFKKIDADTFKMTYESNTSNAGWKLGDFIVFKRTK